MPNKLHCMMICNLWKITAFGKSQFTTFLTRQRDVCSLIHNLIAIPQDEELHNYAIPADGTRDAEVHMFKVQTSDSTN